jgi:SnoaL-like domain
VSASNVELHRRAVDAINARELETLVAGSDPSIEWHPLFAGAMGAAVHHGHDGIRQWFRDLEDAWGDELHIEPEAYFDLGEQTLLIATLRGRGRQSGVNAAMPYAAVARWCDGLCVYAKLYTDPGEALRDLGVTEDELEPIAP